MSVVTRVAIVGALLAGALLIALAVAGSLDSDDEQPAAVTRAPWRPPPDCPVTIPNGRTPPGERRSPDYHGNGRLWTGLVRDGKFTVAPRSEYIGPNGKVAVDGLLLPDGSVAIKAPWWRGPGVRGRIRLRARRLDRPAPRVDRTVSPHGYGLTGFQAMTLNLPTTGCWKVTGSARDASLTFVTLVWRARRDST
jgi:hypothetical protein